MESKSTEMFKENGILLYDIKLRVVQLTTKIQIKDPLKQQKNAKDGMCVTYTNLGKQ